VLVALGKTAALVGTIRLINRKAALSITIMATIPAAAPIDCSVEASPAARIAAKCLTIKKPDAY